MVHVLFPEQCNYAGCGKRTVVRYVARRLGLHVVEYNCHDLIVSDRTSVALAQAFKTAQRLNFVSANIVAYTLFLAPFVLVLIKMHTLPRGQEHTVPLIFFTCFFLHSGFSL